MVEVLLRFACIIFTLHSLLSNTGTGIVFASYLQIVHKNATALHGDKGSGTVVIGNAKLWHGGKAINSTDPLFGLSWVSIRKINGLKNSEVAFLVISSWVNNGQLYRDRIIPAARTWMRLALHVFVVIEDTADARLAFRNCPMNGDDNVTSFSCAHEPTVILSRSCSTR